MKFTKSFFLYIYLMTIEELKYPIGQAQIPSKITQDYIDEWTKTLTQFPNELECLVANLSEEQLNTPYREDGWTVRQVVHHCADSHHNSYIRFKWALTEDKPIIKAYFEDRWADLFDYQAPIKYSILHLKAVHARLVYLINGMNDEQLNKSFIHPETKKEVSLKENIGIYAWHCNHHFAHIENLLIRKGWK